MTLQDIVNIQISLSTLPITQVGFGTLLIVGTETHIPGNERVREYEDLAGMTADSFLTTDDSYLAAQEAFSQVPRPVSVKVGRKITSGSPDASWSAAIDAIRAIDDDWYGVIITSKVAADIEEVAAHVETLLKLHGAQTADAGAIDPASTTDVLYLLKAANYQRTFTLYNVYGTAGKWAAAGWMGRQLPKVPGQETWALKTIVGVVADKLTPTASSAVRNKNGNTYETAAGVSLTRDGKVAGGNYIDLIHGRDWLQQRMSERIFAGLASSGKVPYTDSGIRTIGAAIRAQLQEGVNNDFLASFTVKLPMRVDVPTSDVAARTLNLASFTAVGAGAIQGVNITGNITN